MPFSLTHCINTHHNKAFFGATPYATILSTKLDNINSTIPKVSPTGVAPLPSTNGLKAM